MKKIILASVFLSVFFTCNSQINNQEKILSIYGEGWIENINEHDPSLLKLVDNYISYGFLIKNVSEGKYSELVPLTQVPNNSKIGGFTSISEFLLDFESSSFNPLKYDFFPSKNYQIFKLSGVNKIIYILPQATILSK